MAVSGWECKDLGDLESSKDRGSRQKSRLQGESGLPQ